MITMWNKDNRVQSDSDTQTRVRTNDIQRYAQRSLSTLRSSDVINTRNQSRGMSLMCKSDVDASLVMLGTPAQSFNGEH